MTIEEYKNLSPIKSIKNIPVISGIIVYTQFSDDYHNTVCQKIDNLKAGESLQAYCMKWIGKDNSWIQRGKMCNITKSGYMYLPYVPQLKEPIIMGNTKEN